MPFIFGEPRACKQINIGTEKIKIPTAPHENKPMPRLELNLIIRDITLTMKFLIGTAPTSRSGMIENTNNHDMAGIKNAVKIRSMP